MLYTILSALGSKILEPVQWLSLSSNLFIPALFWWNTFNLSGFLILLVLESLETVGRGVKKHLFRPRRCKCKQSNTLRSVAPFGKCRIRLCTSLERGAVLSLTSGVPSATCLSSSLSDLYLRGWPLVEAECRA